MSVAARRVRMASRTGKSVTYLQHTGDAGDLTTYTFAATNLGAASGGRFIIAAIGARATGSTALTVSSVTIGGVTATQIVQAENSPTNANLAAIYMAAVPIGTTGDVVVTLSRAAVRCSIDLWSATGISTTAHDTDSSTADPSTATLDTLGAGVLVAVSVSAGASPPTFTWTNATERYDGLIVAAEGTGGAVSVADTVTTAGTLAVTADGSAATVEPVAVFASW